MEKKKKTEQDSKGTFYISKVSESNLTKKECQESSANTSIKGLENMLKDMKKKKEDPLSNNIKKSNIEIFELDLLKGRAGDPIGTEKQWGGNTYVKTPMGWKPKAKGRESKPEEAPSNRAPKIEEPLIPKEKQLEDFAAKAKDSQLEAAIKDPKQDEEVKKIAREELEKRKVELTEDLDKKKKEAEIKVIKKTGIVVDGHKMFITMNDKGTGYVSKGHGINLKSEEGEDLSVFKEKVKLVLEEQFGKKKEEFKETKTQLEADLDKKLSEEIKFIKKTGIVVDGHKMFITMDKDRYVSKGFGLSLKSEENETLKDFKEKVKIALEEKFSGEKKIVPETKEVPHKERADNIKELEKSFERYMNSPETELSWKNSYEYARDKFLPGEEPSIAVKTRRAEAISTLNASKDPLDILAINKVLVDSGELPYCNPIFYKEYEGESYLVNENDLHNKEANLYFNKQKDKTPKRTSEEADAFSLYIGSGYEALNLYALTGDIEDVISEYGENGLSSEDLETYLKETTETINTYIDTCPPIEENVVLSRRVYGQEISKIINDLKVDDTFEMKPFQSFSLIAMQGFGDCQITLLAKKGTKGIAPIGMKDDEMEYLTKTNSRARVISKGYNSMTIELM